MPTRLLVVPHCTTEYNEQKRLQGQLDIALNQRGHEQAREVSTMLAKIDVAAIYSSDLSRCIESASPLAATHQLEVNLHLGLRGRHYGVIQGMRYSDIKDQFPPFYHALQQRDLHMRFCQPTEQGESLAEFETRSMSAVKDCLARHKPSGSKVAIVVIVAHGGVVDCIIRRARRLPIDAVVDGRLYDPVQNYFLFESGEFRVCSSLWDC